MQDLINNPAAKNMVGFYVPSHGESYISSTYSRMYSLLINVDKHKAFVVSTFMPGSDIGLPILKHYCLNNNKILVIDTHQCGPGCTSPPNIITIVNLKSGINDPDNIIPPFEVRDAILEDHIYDELVTMSKIERLECESGIIHYNNGKLETLLGDVRYFKRSNYNEHL